jgi:hypothetical protein
MGSIASVLPQNKLVKKYAADAGMQLSKLTSEVLNNEG